MFIKSEIFHHMFAFQCEATFGKASGWLCTQWPQFKALRVFASAYANPDKRRLGAVKPAKPVSAWFIMYFDLQSV